MPLRRLTGASWLTGENAAPIDCHARFPAGGRAAGLGRVGNDRGYGNHPDSYQPPAGSRGLADRFLPGPPGPGSTGRARYPVSVAGGTSQRSGAAGRRPGSWREGLPEQPRQRPAIGRRGSRAGQRTSGNRRTEQVSPFCPIAARPPRNRDDPLPARRYPGCYQRGGEWSRLRTSRQGKRAEEGDDDLVNHASQMIKRRQQSARLRPRRLGEERACQPGSASGPVTGISEEDHRRDRPRVAVGQRTAAGPVTPASSHDRWGRVEAE